MTPGDSKVQCQQFLTFDSNRIESPLSFAIVRCQLVVLLRRSEQNIILCLLKISFLKPKQKIRKKKFQKKMPEGGCRT